MTCLVTGASGFIGRALCRALSARQLDFVPVVRKASSIEGDAVHCVDLNQPIDWRPLLQGIDSVVHLAGIAHMDAPAEDYERVNHQATLSLARAAAEEGVRQFIFVSSVKAMGEGTGAIPRAESAIGAHPEPYGLSKWLAEEALRREFADSTMAIVILRPALVYGGDARGNLASVQKAMHLGLPRPPAGGGRSMISRTDLVALIVQLLQNSVTGVQTWTVCDGQAYSLRDIYDALRAAAGKDEGHAWLPAWVWRLACELPSPGRGALRYRKMFGWELYDGSAVIAATGWQPRKQLADEAHEMLAGMNR